MRGRFQGVNHRPSALAAVALMLLLSACAPVLPPPVPASPLPETAVESPSPGGTWSDFVVAEADLDGLRAAGLLVPVKGVSPSKIEDSFDAPRDGGRRHDAVDILAPRGTPVVSATDGWVLRVGTNSLGGNVVWTSDPDQRFVHYYAHLDRYARGIRAGERVQRGTVLGYVGTTGNAPPNVPHLHFQVMRVNDAKRWWDGTPVNPRPFLVEEVTVTAATTPRRSPQ
jgi:murein DD-endopeptidase MepM/ murein hydrolase activator NlpD